MRLATLVRPVFCSNDLDLDLDPVTLILALDINILEMYPRTENEVRRSRLSIKKLQPELDEETDRHRDATERSTMPRLEVVKVKFWELRPGF